MAGTTTGITGADAQVAWNETAEAGDNYNIQMDFSSITAMHTQLTNLKEEGSQVFQKLLGLDNDLYNIWNSDAHKTYTAELESGEESFKILIGNALENVYALIEQGAKNISNVDTTVKTGMSGQLSSEEGKITTIGSGSGSNTTP